MRIKTEWRQRNDEDDDDVQETRNAHQTYILCVNFGCMFFFFSFFSPNKLHKKIMRRHTNETPRFTSVCCPVMPLHIFLERYRANLLLRKYWNRRVFFFWLSFRCSILNKIWAYGTPTHIIDKLKINETTMSQTNAEKQQQTPSSMTKKKYFELKEKKNDEYMTNVACA